MAMAKNNGWMARNIKGNIVMAKNKAMENFTELILVNMRENLKKMKFMVKVFIHEMMVDNILANGVKIK